MIALNFVCILQKFSSKMVKNWLTYGAIESLRIINPNYSWKYPRIKNILSAGIRYKMIALNFVCILQKFSCKTVKNWLTYGAVESLRINYIWKYPRIERILSAGCRYTMIALSFLCILQKSSCKTVKNWLTSGPTESLRIIYINYNWKYPRIENVLSPGIRYRMIATNSVCILHKFSCKTVKNWLIYGATESLRMIYVENIRGLRRFNLRGLEIRW